MYQYYNSRYIVIILISVLTIGFLQSFAIENNEGGLDFKFKNYENKSVELEMLAKYFVGKIDKVAKVIEETGNLSQVRDVEFIDHINRAINGIPETSDIEKRKVAKEILSKYPEFTSVGFILPNGDVYALEPFSRQLNLTTNNLGFRDYFKIVTNTSKTYLSDVIVSKSSARSLAVMATPVLKDNVLQGIWYGTIDFNNYNDILQSLYPDSETRIIILDKKGTKLADSNKSELISISNKTNLPQFSFNNLTSFKIALEGKSGKIVENVANKTSLVYYQPYDLYQNGRIIMLIQECNNEKIASNSTKIVNCPSTG